MTGASLGGLAFAGCGSGDAGTSSGDGSQYKLVETMQKRGRAILGIIDSPPSSFLKDDKPTGYNVEIVQAILRDKYDISEFEAFQADFVGMVPGLQARRMDICCAGLLITDERCQSIAMSAASYVLIYSFAVKPGNPDNLAAIADIKDAGATLAVEKATTQERVAREILDGKQIITVAGRQDGADAVRIGRADAYLAPQSAIEQVLDAGGDPLDITDDVADMPKTGSAYAMHKDDADFAAAFSDDFAELKESGEYAKILEKYDADPTLIEMDGVQLTCPT
ncbi:MAG: transporter substrate-binding domain-containing protein [Propionibacteriaceae bacterium]